MRKWCEMFMAYVLFSGIYRGRQKSCISTGMSFLRNECCITSLYWRCILHTYQGDSTKRSTAGKFKFNFPIEILQFSWAILTGLSKSEFYSIYFNSLQALSNGSSSEKLHSRRRSRWWRIRSIFALVFKRRRHSNWIYKCTHNNVLGTRMNTTASIEQIDV